MGFKEWYESWTGSSGEWMTKMRFPGWADLTSFIENRNFNSQGFSNKINWNLNYEKAMRAAKENNKPLMLIVHADDCRSCKSFRDWFSRSSGVQEMSHYFSMVALTPESLPRNPGITQDGHYVPQVIFISPQGKVIHEGERKGAEIGQKHFFPGTTPMLDAMNAVLKTMESKW